MTCFILVYKMQLINQQTEVDLEYVNNKTAAEMLGVKITTLHWHVSRNGAYFGITPNKLANGRIMWKKEDIEKFIRGEK